MNPRSIFALPALAMLGLMSSRAYALDEEYQALVSAIEATRESATEVEEVRTRIAEHEALKFRIFKGQDPWTVDRARAKECQDLDAELANELAAANASLATLNAAVDRARERFRRACKPYEDLRAEALRTYQSIQASGKDPSNVRRALMTIRRDLNAASGSQVTQFARILDQFLIGLKAGQPADIVEAGLRELATTDAEKAFLGGLGKIATDMALEHGPERLNRINTMFGRADAAAKAVRILAGGTNEPFGNEAMERLTGTIDLASDLVPEGALPIRMTLMLHLEMVKAIYASMRELSYQQARTNLVALNALATTRDTRISGEIWDGLVPSALFGKVEGDPEITLNASEFYRGDKIEVTYTGSSWWTGSGWIGLVPARVPHGSESVCDREDVEYHNMTSESGKMTFEVPEQPGTWTLRMFDQDTTFTGDGREVFSVTLQVNANGYAHLVPARTEVRPGDMLDVECSTLNSDGKNFWVAIVPSEVSHEDYLHEAGDKQLGWQYVPARVNSHLSFRVPAGARSLDFRMYRNTDSGTEEVACTTIRVLRMPFGMQLEKTVFAPGEEIIVRYGGLATFEYSAWIGILPSSVEHGDESRNDQYDITYQYLRGETSGYFLFRAPASAGAWDLRMHNTDGGGKEFGSVSITVR